MLIDGKRFFDMPIKNEEERYEQIIEMRRNNDYATGNVLDYEYENFWIFTKFCNNCVIMETQKTANLLMIIIIINDRNNTGYGDGDENGTTIKFETKVIKSNLCDYSDAYILVTGDITATNGNTG